MYHRVVPRGEIEGTIQPGMYVDPEVFEIHVKFLRNYFQILPLSALAAPSDPTGSHPMPTCFLTFDDGWKDFYVHAFPVLNAYRVPATVFLPTEYIGTEDWFWTDRLAYLFSRRSFMRKRHKPSKNSVINKLERMRGSQESRLEKSINILKKHQMPEIEDVLQELSARWEASLPPSRRVFLTWDEVKEMRNSKLVTFGSHGATHRILTMLSENDVKEELTQSKARLISEGVVDAEFVPFCYPNGNYHDGILELARKAGYALAVTTDAGWVTPDLDRFRLKRVSLHQDISSSEALLGLRVAGAARLCGDNAIE
jgi:peptidoglycan/xylan/chitin deacetylase (PgdA/CDA1 family)